LHKSRITAKIKEQKMTIDKYVGYVLNTHTKTD